MPSSDLSARNLEHITHPEDSRPPHRSYARRSAAPYPTSACVPELTTPDALVNRRSGPSAAPSPLWLSLFVKDQAHGPSDFRPAIHARESHSIPRSSHVKCLLHAFFTTHYSSTHCGDDRHGDRCSGLVTAIGRRACHPSQRIAFHPHATPNITNATLTICEYVTASEPKTDVISACGS